MTKYMVAFVLLASLAPTANANDRSDQVWSLSRGWHTPDRGSHAQPSVNRSATHMRSDGAVGIRYDPRREYIAAERDPRGGTRYVRRSR